MTENGASELTPALVVRQSKILLGMRVLVVHLFFFILCAVFLLLAEQDGSSEMKFRTFAWINVAELLALFYAVLRWHNHYYLIKPDKILTSRGVFLRHQWVFAIRNIESIDLEQGFFGRIFNFGTLYFHAPTLNKKISMWGINNPQKKELIIERLLPATTETKRPRRENPRLMVVKGK